MYKYGNISLLIFRVSQKFADLIEVSDEIKPVPLVVLQML